MFNILNSDAKCQDKDKHIVVSCNIRGLRHPDNQASEAKDPQSKQDLDEGIRIIKIEGCDYKILEESLV
jgi:hypothetical protein